MDIEQIQSLLDSHDQNELTLELRKSMFKAGYFDFIVEGIANNSEGNWEKGKKAVHEKQKEALKALTGNEYDLFFYGGGAGSGKSFLGMNWIVFSALCYPNTRYFIARNELKDIRDSVLVTFREVTDNFGIKNYNYNAVNNIITFDNKSVINLIEVKYKPSDPEYTDVGSTLYTSGWFEEVGEINEKAVSILQTRVNRWKVDEYGINGIVLLTGNPSKNWTKREFHDKYKNGELEKENADPENYNKKYINCLVVENPFMTEKYIRSLRLKAKTDRSAYEVLFKGNWDFSDNPNQLTKQEAIEDIFDNNHVSEGMSYLTADVAFQGSDKAVIIAWKGWVAKEVVVFDKSSTQDILTAIMVLRQRYRIPKSRCIGDGDGAGTGVVDISGIKSFRNNGIPIRMNKEMPNYRNIQVQCLYLLADRINDGEIWIDDVELSGEQKKHIKEELAQIQSANNKRDSDKLDCKIKAEIKKDIGRSPDYRDALMMRIWFDLKPQRRAMVTTSPRDYF